METKNQFTLNATILPDGGVFLDFDIDDFLEGIGLAPNPSLGPTTGSNLFDEEALDAALGLANASSHFELPGDDIRITQSFPCSSFGSTDDATKNNVASSDVDTPRSSHRVGCGLCTTTFARRYDIQRHMKTHHNIQTVFYECETCSRIFTRRDGLMRHRNRVHREATVLPGRNRIAPMFLN